MKLILRGDATVWHIAQVCHEAIAAHCRQHGEPDVSHWIDAPSWQLDASYDSVFLLMELPDAGDSLLHDMWTADKLAAGWEYGEVKDTVKKTHPCLVPYEELPPFQREKNMLYVAIVKALTQPLK